ncbi:hypothetical protein XM38_039790 [Halomicronema hongdechloris C2206]|uniref:Uncharacterized protein n=1 Tax=Halomicronema hongdechloris C2206 TaxID=1641165 RepID=A0A1Z3HSB4_9CYAN|nr:hypothetical protein [Halomicronema hongdechloris]ASC73017.1 hypothetical protein XM38_039790 [Halomicronema hongdechloris C2206]
MLRDLSPPRVTPINPDVPTAVIPTVTLRGQNLALTDLSVRLGAARVGHGGPVSWRNSGCR